MLVAAVPKKTKDKDITVEITSPAANSVQEVGKNITVEGKGKDPDCRKIDANPWESFFDTVKYTWSGGGNDFTPNGTSPTPDSSTGEATVTSTWKAPQTVGNVTITLTANDEGSDGDDNDDDPQFSQRAFKLVKIKKLSANYSVKTGGAIECTIPSGYVSGAEDIYVPLSAQVTLTATPDPTGDWPTNRPYWSYSLSSSWTKSLTHGNPVGTVTPTTSGSGYATAQCGYSTSGSAFSCSFNIKPVTVENVTATQGSASVDSTSTESLKILKNTSASLTATINPTSAPSYSTACLKWKVTSEPSGSSYALDTSSTPVTFSASTTGEYTIAGFLDADGNDSPGTGESSKSVNIEVCDGGLVRFVDDKIDVFDTETDTTDFNVEVVYPAEAGNSVSVVMTNTSSPQYTEYSGITTKAVTLDGSGNGTLTFTLKEKAGVGAGIDTLTATISGTAYSDTRSGRACGVTGTDVVYQSGGVNSLNIDFYVEVQTEGVGLEHYQKRQYWAANPQSTFSDHRLEYPTGTVVQAHVITNKQDEVDWTSWHDADEDATDHQLSSPGSAFLNGKTRFGYLDCETRYFTVRYKNTTTSNDHVSGFDYDWGFGWNNHNFRVGDWWTEMDTGNGTVISVNNITDFPSSWYTP